MKTYEDLKRQDPSCGKEVQFLSRLQHENVIRLHEVYVCGEVTEMVLELCSCSMRMQLDVRTPSRKNHPKSQSLALGEARRRLDAVPRYISSLFGAEGYKPPSCKKVKTAMQHLLRALTFLHENQVAHCTLTHTHIGWDTRCTRLCGGSYSVQPAVLTTSCEAKAYPVHEGVVVQDIMPRMARHASISEPEVT